MSSSVSNVPEPSASRFAIICSTVSPTRQARIRFRIFALTSREMGALGPSTFFPGSQPTLPGSSACGSLDTRVTSLFVEAPLSGSLLYSQRLRNLAPARVTASHKSCLATIHWKGSSRSRS